MRTGAVITGQHPKKSNNFSVEEEVPVGSLS